MSFCANCGNRLSDSAKFCGHCGSSVTQISASNSSSHTSKKLAKEYVSDISRTLFVLASRVLPQFRSLMQRVGATPLDIVGSDDSEQLQVLAVKRIRKAFQTGQLRYVCIIGDWNDVPPFRLESPLPEQDSHCVTDAPYGVIGGCDFIDFSNTLSFVPEIPVGRVPSADIDVLERLILSPASDSTPIDSLRFAICCESWKMVTETILASILNTESDGGHPNKLMSFDTSKVDLLTSPDLDDSSLSETVFDNQVPPGSLMLFNVHGTPDETSWYGEEANNRRNQPKIFHPGTIQSYKNSVVVSEACFGGALGYDEMSVSEHFFENGGRAFVGCSVTAYGLPDGMALQYRKPIEELIFGADLIALNFVKAMQSGMSFGDSLNHAKCEVAISPSDCELESLKTIMSFNLYGLPWQTFTNRQLKPRVGQDDAPLTINVRERVRNRMDTLREKVFDSLSSRREDYRSRLPERLQRHILSGERFLNILGTLKDRECIDSALKYFDAEFSKCSFEQVSSDIFSGYKVSGKTSMSFGGDGTFSIITDSDGLLERIIVSKGC